MSSRQEKLKYTNIIVYNVTGIFLITFLNDSKNRKLWQIKKLRLKISLSLPILP